MSTIYKIKYNNITGSWNVYREFGETILTRTKTVAIRKFLERDDIEVREEGCFTVYTAGNRKGKGSLRYE